MCIRDSLETLKYKSEKEDATVMIPFHSNRLMDYNKQKLFSGGYLSVSYTHLDVYKRQEQTIRTIWQEHCRLFATIPVSELFEKQQEKSKQQENRLKQSLEPVSYTHLWH